ncbi:MAG TPA: flagellar basal body rod protein FlgB [Sandaracinaceae bacterium LLY-WYZ-13_1]|nr:flagellar basal body rod protein FlgB [Sandaracinaceae bacterium LLY-WYZ-13_1]
MAHPVLTKGGVTQLFDGVSILHRALDYHLERHNVLASNVANVDTPGFRPLELVREDLPAESGGTLPLAATDRAHLRAGRGELGPFRLEEAEERVVNPGNDGNAVSLEREMSKVAANQLRYDGAVRIVRSRLGLLRYAANDGRG